MSRSALPLSIAFDQCPRCTSPGARKTFVEQASNEFVPCNQCGTELCGATQNGRIAFAAIDDVCKHYGFDVELPRPCELVELLRANLDSSTDRSVLWGESDEPDHGSLLTSEFGGTDNPSTGSHNPYAPPDSSSRRSDPDGDAYVFSAIIACDPTSLGWNVATYARQSDVYALLVLSMFFGVGAGIYLFEEWFADWLANGRVLIASVAAVIVLPLIGRIAVRPYAKLLLQRAHRDPLYSEDQLSVEVRLHTLSAWNSRSIDTWRLSEVRRISGDPQLFVLRVEPKRQLYFNTSSQTNPESFAAFEKGIKRRLRRNHWRRLRRRQ